MKKYSPQLLLLDLRDNPICADKAYRSTTLRKLRHLERCGRHGVRVCLLWGHRRAPQAGPHSGVAGAQSLTGGPTARGFRLGRTT
jgi:hypothetical protein